MKMPGTFLLLKRAAQAQNNFVGTCLEDMAEIGLREFEITLPKCGSAEGDFKTSPRATSSIFYQVCPKASYRT